MSRHNIRKFDMRGARNRSLGTKSIGLALGIFFGLAASVVFAAGESSTPREIVVGVPASFPPYFQLDSEGRPFGFAIDVTEAVAIRAGLKVRYKVWAHARDNQAALRAGTVDVLPSLGISKRRLQDFSFTAPIETFQISLFVRKDSVDIDGLESLGQRPVGAVVPNLAHRILSQRGNINLTTYNDAPAALFALLSAQIDAFAYPAPVAWKFAREAGIGERIKIVGKPIAEIKRAMAVRKGNTELLAILDPAVREFVASEDYRRIYTAWFGAPAVYWTVLRILWVAAVVGAMLLIAMAWWRYHSLVNLNRGLRESISERERAEKALRETEERFRDMAESASDWFWEMGPDLRFTYHSERYFEITGFRPEEKIGTARTRYVDPTDREADAEKWTAHLADLETHKPFKNFEYSFASSTGRVCHARISGTPIFDSDGAFRGYRGTGTDITERKRAEEALQQSQAELIRAQEIAKVGSWTWRLDDGGMISVSDEYLQIIGFPADQPPKNQAEFNHHIYPDDLERCVKIFDQAVNTPSDFEAEYRFVRPDGKIRHIVEFGELVYDDRGRAVGHAGTIQDITERTVLEEQLRQAQKMEAVGQLTAGVAHDFNNILAVIWGNAELLGDELGEDNQRLISLFRAVERGSELTQRLLAFSRRQMLKPEIIIASNLVADIIGLMRRTLEEHIDIGTVTAAGLWNCEVDPAQLENALVNLAINARDAMPDGGKLTIETANARLDDDYAAAQADVTPGQYVMLAVTDTGTGMPPEVREHVFEPFFTTKEVGHGSGLGLSMVYGFVKQSGGHVTVYSEEGEGTTIKIYLPRSAGAGDVERKPAMDEVPVAQGETVLVVEDDPDVRTLAVALLSKLGYQIMEAATGAAALAELGTTTRVNLLLTDVVLPGGMNGRELATEIARRVPGIQVLYMSGYTEDAIMHHGRLDADAKLLQKPFRRADLARAVRSVLDGPST